VLNEYDLPPFRAPVEAGVAHRRSTSAFSAPRFLGSGALSVPA
jgi:hypothetical protein